MSGRPDVLAPWVEEGSGSVSVERSDERFGAGQIIIQTRKALSLGACLTSNWRLRSSASAVVTAVCYWATHCSSPPLFCLCAQVAALTVTPASASSVSGELTGAEMENRVDDGQER